MSANGKVAVLGAGAWGTALAAALARGPRPTALWGRDVGTIDLLREERRSPRYLPGVSLPGGIAAAASMAEALRDARTVLVVVPVAALKDTLAQAAPLLATDADIVLCAKGIAPGEGDASEPMLPSALARAALDGCIPPERIGALSGPSFAADVARGLPTAVALAMPEREGALRVARALSTRPLRCYPTDDLRGVELGGALKNVVAIGAGITLGRGLGASAHAAFLTRGHAEMARIAVALGARSETLMGLSGLGDLLLTASSGQSRNFAHGLALGRGDAPASATVEGVRTAATAAALARREGLRAPIIAALDAILHRGAEIDRTVAALLERPVPEEE